MTHLNNTLEQFEFDLTNNNFTKQWLSDESGYWFERNFYFPVFDTIKCIVEPDIKKMYMEVNCDTIATEGGTSWRTFDVTNWNDCINLLFDFNLLADGK